MKMQWVEVDYDKPKPSLKNVKAKALYDNLAESVDELAFRKGEILDVIEQNADGMDGWWLCSLRGRIGLCPGNRLRVIDYETSSCYTPTSPLSSPCSTSMSMSASTLTFSSQNSNTSELYENTSNKNFKGKRRSWHINPNKVITPQKFGDVYLYDLLPSNANSRLNSPGPSITSSLSFDADNYDIPKAAIPVNNDIIRQPRHQGISRHSVLSTSSTATSLFSRMDDSYDVPRSSSNLGKMTPSSSNSSLLTSDSLSLSFSSSNRSSLANMPDYDIPRKQPVSIKRTPPPPQSQSILSLKSLDLNSENYDVPSPHVNIHSPKKLGIVKELPLELSSALDTLSRLQNEATISVTKLLSFVNTQWRTREKLEPIIMEIKLAVVRLKTSLHDLAEFAEGSLGNSLKTEDKNLSIKLRPLVKALKDADKLIHEACNALDAQGWNIEYLQRLEQPKNTKTKTSLPPDSLDQLIVVSQTLTEDIRQTSSFIQGNASLLFKRNVTTPSTPVSQATWPEDSDYVSLESEENVAKKNAEIRNALPNNLKHNFDKVVKSAELGTDINEPLDPNDKTVLLYYTSQCCTHIKYLTEAIDSFLKTVEHNQPPKFFLAYGKFVVLSAHNLVNIGDIVHRNVTKKNVKARILSCADSLSESLKTCVMKTKKAAQSFPSVTAVQQMVDSVVDISHLASDLKLAMLEAVTIP
ncbi:breast cancer anti-estrogen resistance protein 1 [Chironomus tepperi]|uniref:breast cancer anti-estrogen resistance protein 1 n=1 Tax=Chironomus tepperi TaxID=113505 RepID=UPI00391F4C57